MTPPSVSIIVPVYNVRPYVEDSIRSVMRQTYDGPIECIVVDDCGTDNSMAVVDRLIADYSGPISFKVLHHDHNRGLSAARNTGMDAVTSDYLFFLDSDDELTDDCLEKLTEPLEKERYDIVVGNVQYLKILSSNEIIKTKGNQEIRLPDKTLLEVPRILRSLGNKWGVVAWNRLYRTIFLHQNHLIFKEGLLYEDNLWSFQLACLASSLYVVNHITYIYKIREGSIMGLRSMQEFERNYTIIVQEINKFAKNHHVEKAETHPFFNYLFCCIMDFYSSSSRMEFESVYKTFRPYIPASIKNIIRSNRYHLKNNFRDIHYLLPINIASRWQYYIYFIRNIVSKRINLFCRMLLKKC